MKFSTLQEIIDFAIDREKNAVTFYTTCQERAGRPEMKSAFIEMVEEEKRHVTLLENIQLSSFAEDTVDSVNNPKMEMYIIEKPFHPSMSYQELLQLAIHREASSYQLYTMLGEKTDDGKGKALLKRLAEEELMHKERLEEEYNMDVLQEN